MRFDIIKKVYIWLTIWAIAMWGCLLFFFTNINLSIEFTWWIKMIVDSQAKTSDIKSWLIEYSKTVSWFDLTEKDLTVISKDNTIEILYKWSVKNDTQFNLFADSMKKWLVDKSYISSQDKILETSMIGPSVWEYMKKSAVQAIVYWILFMWIYIFFAFSAMRIFIPPWILAVVTILTMFFDITIPAWAYGILMRIDPTIQLDSIFIIAILTVVGYSINDTIIIFDRIRENFLLNQNKIKQWKLTYRKIFEDSLWQTMRRSIWTVLSTLLVVVAMYFFGTWSLKIFAFTLFFWILSGSYSSIFISAWLAYIMSGKYKKEQTIQD